MPTRPVPQPYSIPFMSFDNGRVVMALLIISASSTLRGFLSQSLAALSKCSVVVIFYNSPSVSKRSLSASILALFPMIIR